MSMIGATATTYNAQVRQEVDELGIQCAELLWIAVIQRLGHVEFGVAQA